LSAPLIPDREQVTRFVDALFKRADPAGYVALRVFRDKRGGSWEAAIKSGDVRLGDPNLITKFLAWAELAATHGEPAVFSPPMSTFIVGDRARLLDLHEGLAVIVELDERPRSSLDAVAVHLGRPTLAIESGGLWTDPKTGEIEPRIHAYWRLAAPTRTMDEHQDLRMARRLVCDLVAADTSAVPLVHPLRCAGSWHRKAEQPRLARIVEENDVDLDLQDTLRRLRSIPDEGFRRKPNRNVRATPNPEKQADPADVAATLSVIPNSDWSWDDWNRIGMATWAATQGDLVAGLEAFQTWSACSAKHVAEITEARWEHYATSPPDQLGAGTLFYQARKFESGWVKPSARFDASHWFEEPPPAKPVEPPLFPEPRPDATSKITATPFVWTDPSQFPKRRWLYGSHLIRKFVSCTVAPGGLGKSSLVLVEAIAMATGRPLLGIQPAETPLTVWVINLEDPQEEIERRVLAILLRYGIDPAEVVGRLYIDSGRRLPLVVAETTREGTAIAQPLIKAFRDEILARKVDVVVIDPFVKSHRVPENDNGAIDTVATVFAGLADACNIAIDLVHHVRKTNGAEVTVEDGRGAVALLGAVRSARALNGMSRDEAAKVGDSTSPREFFRVDNGKLNMAPAPPDRAEWFRLVSVPLGNGDSVGCVVNWRWPDAMAGITSDHLREVQVAVASGRWRENHQAREWVGNAVAQALHMDVSQKAHRAKVLGLVKAWLKSGALVVVHGQDERRKPVAYVEVGAAA
jgi:hypothetical protein